MDVLEERLSLGGSVGVRTLAAPGLMSAPAARRLLLEHAVDKLVGDAVRLIVSQRSDESGTQRRVLSFVPASRAPASQPSDVLETSTVFLTPHPFVDDKVLVECVTDAQAAARPPAPPFVCRAAVPRSTRTTSDRVASVTTPVVPGAQVQKTASNTSKNSASSAASAQASAVAAPPAASAAATTTTAPPPAPAASVAPSASPGAAAAPAARAAPHGSLMSMFARQQQPKPQAAAATPSAAPAASVKSEPTPAPAATSSPAAAAAQRPVPKPSVPAASKRRVDSSDDEAEPAGKRHDAASSSKPSAAAAASAPVEPRRSASPEVRARVPRRVRRVSDSDDEDGDKKKPAGKSAAPGAAASAAKRPEVDHKEATSPPAPLRGAPRVLEPRPAPAAAAPAAAAASSSSVVAKAEPKAQPATAQAAASSSASGAPAEPAAAAGAAAANADAPKIPTLIAPAARKRRTKKVMKEVTDASGYLEYQLVEVTDDEAGGEAPAAGAKPDEVPGPGAAAAAAAAAAGNAPRAGGAVKAAPTKQLGLASFFGRK